MEGGDHDPRPARQKRGTHGRSGGRPPGARPALHPHEPRHQAERPDRRERPQPVLRTPGWVKRKGQARAFHATAATSSPGLHGTARLPRLRPFSGSWPSCETEGGQMRVGRVEASAVRYPEPKNDGKIRSLTLVRVETDDGLVGWGEAITGGQEASLAVAFVVERRLAPLVVGADPRDDAA